MTLALLLVLSSPSARAEQPLQVCLQTVQSTERELSALTALDDGLAALSGDLVLLSHDGGTSWTTASVLESDEEAPVLASSGRTVAVVSGEQLLLSRDGGASFLPQDLPCEPPVRSVALLGGGEELLCLGEGGLTRLALFEGGPRLARRVELDEEVTALAAAGSVVLIASTGALRVSGDGGVTWARIEGVRGEGEVTAAFVDRQGRAWLASEGGVDVVEPGAPRAERRLSWLGGPRVQAIAVVDEEPLVVADGELFRVRLGCTPGEVSPPVLGGQRRRRRRPLGGLLPELSLEVVWGTGRLELLVALRWPLLFTRPDPVDWEASERRLWREASLARERLMRSIVAWRPGQAPRSVTASLASGAELARVVEAGMGLELARVEQMTAEEVGRHGLDQSPLAPLPSLAAWLSR